MKKIALFFTLFTGIITAQNNDCTCCKENNKQFDFWIGNWKVLDTLGNKVGENKIIKIQDNCVLQEFWTGTKGSTGTSINYFEKKDSTWNQLWIDNTGNTLKLKGKYISDKMILKSDVIQGKKTNYYNQITWSKNEDGTVSQLWEIYSEKNKLLKTVFLGIYHKK